MLALASILKLAGLLWGYAAPLSSWAKSKNGRTSLTMGLGALSAMVLFLSLVGTWHAIGSQHRTDAAVAAAVTATTSARDDAWKLRLGQAQLQAVVLARARDRASQFAADVQRAAFNAERDAARNRISEVERLLRNRSATAATKSAASGKSGGGNPRDSPARAVVYPQAVAKLINDGRR
jgi:hypothetical protein